MQKKRIWLIVFALMLVTALGGLSMAERETEDNPCKDTRYLELKDKDLNTLSAREYEVFKSKDETCNQYKQNSRTVKVLEKSESHSNTWLWITLAVTVIPLVILGV